MLQDSLSALLDGECSGSELDRLLDELDRSPELGRQWSRLCLAREARSGTRVGAEQPCICGDVMARLDAVPERAGDKIVDLAVGRANRAGRRPLLGYWKPALGFAAAASMGAAAVMFVQPQGGVEGRPYVSAGSVATLAAPDRNLRLVSDQDAAHTQMLREYLMDHSNAVADEGLGSTLRYARFAAHTAEPVAYSGSFPDDQP